MDKIKVDNSIEQYCSNCGKPLLSEKQEICYHCGINLLYKQSDNSYD